MQTSDRRGQAPTIYSDAGAACTDVVDGVITPESGRFITTGVEAVSSVEYTPADSPYVITYDCRDRLGNAAPTQTRTVIVEALCPEPSSICADGTCADTSSGGSICGTGLVVEEEAMVTLEVFTVKENTHPPVITLLPLQKDCIPENGCELKVLTDQDTGKLTFIIVQYLVQSFTEKYVDPGVLAKDTEDGDLTASVSAFGVGAVDLSKPTGPRPYVITYNVKDNGRPQLAADEVRRRVYVTNPCTALGSQQKLCEDSGTCSTKEGLCLGLALEEVVVKENVPPVVTLLGSAAIEVQQYSGFVKCPAGEDVPVSAICDRGATASDVEDGDLTASLMACGASYAERGIEACKLNTDVVGSYIVTFTVEDSSGSVNDVAVTRTVNVAKACKPPTTLCNDQVTCSDPVTLICKEDVLSGEIDIEEEVVDEAPVITLRTHEFLKRQVSVRQYQPYEWCLGDQEPTATLPCELGVNVTDKEEGDLTQHALICPPAACLSVGCPQHKKLNPSDGSINKPLQPFCINTAAPVGAQIDIQFVVFEQSTFPPKNVTVSRTVVIVNPCGDNEQLCPEVDNTCGTIDCAQRAALRAQVLPPDVTPPVLNTSIPDVVEIAYQDKLDAYKYVMCAKCGDADCGMCALDDVDGDVSASLRVVQIKANDADLSCPIAAVTEGQCATGTYLYEYAASDNSGNENTRRLEVRIVSKGEVITQFPVGSYVDPDGQARAEADGMLFATAGSTQNIVFRKSLASVMSGGGAGSYTEDEIEVIGYSSKRITVPIVPGEPRQPPTYAAVLRVRFTVVTGRAAAAAADASSGARRRAQRRRRVLLARSASAADDVKSKNDLRSGAVLEEREEGWSSAGDFSSQFIGHWRRRSLLQATASSSELDDSLAAVSGALVGSATNLSSALEQNALDQGIVVNSAVQDPDPPQSNATTPPIDVDAATSAALTAELEVMQQRVIKMEAALVSVTGALPDAQGDPSGYKQVLEKAWSNGMEQGIKGHTDLLAIATEAIAVLDETIKVQTQGTEAVLLLQEKFIETKNGLLSQLEQLSQALGFSKGNGCDSLLTCLCRKRDNGEIRIDFNATKGKESFVYFKSPPPPPAPTPSPPPPTPPPCSREIVLKYGGCAGDASQANATGRKLLRAAGGRTGSEGADGDGGSNFQVSDSKLEGLTSQFKGYDISLGASTQYAEDTGFVPDRMIKGQNRVMAGILIFQKRSKLSYECSKRFANLRVPCRTGEASTEAFGVDPVFKRGADIFDIDINENIDNFYNTSQLITTIPKGFTQRKEDVEKGLSRFPIFFDIMSRQSQAYRMLSYMIEGNFIDFATEEIEVNIVSYNPDLRRFISHRIVFEFSKGGKIETASKVQVLNLGLYEGTSGVLMFLTEIVTIVWILYMAYNEIREYVSVLRSADYKVLQSLSDHFADHNVANVLEFFSISLQIVAFVVWWVYQFQYALKFSPAKRYEVYYTTAQPQGNFLLPAKDRALNARVVGGLNANDTYTTPKKPYRPWELPDDSSGYEALTGIVDEINTMSNTLVFYGFLQGVNLLLLLVRVMKMLKFQPRLAIVTNTVSGAWLDLAHFGFIFIIYLSMMAVVAHIQFGSNVEETSTMLESFILVFIMLLGGSSGTEFLQPNAVKSFAEELAAGIFYSFMPIFFVLLLLNFFLGILGDSFGDEKEALGEYEGDDLPTDFFKFLQYYSQMMVSRGGSSWPSHWTVRHAVKKAIGAHHYNLLSEDKKHALQKRKSFKIAELEAAAEAEKHHAASQGKARGILAKALHAGTKAIGLNSPVKNPRSPRSPKSPATMEEGFGGADDAYDSLFAGAAPDDDDNSLYASALVDEDDASSELSTESSGGSVEQVVMIDGKRMTSEALIAYLNQIHAEYVDTIHKTDSAAKKRRAALGYSIEHFVDQLVAFEYEDEMDEDTPEAIKAIQEQADALKKERMEALRDQIEKYQDSQEDAMASNIAAAGWMQKAGERLTQLEDNLTMLCEVMEKEGETIRGGKGKGSDEQGLQQGLSDEQRARLLDALGRARAERLAIEEEQKELRAMADMRSRLARGKAAAAGGAGAAPKLWGTLRAAVVDGDAADQRKTKMTSMADVIAQLKAEGRFGVAAASKPPVVVPDQHGVASMFRRRRVERAKTKMKLVANLMAARKALQSQSQ